MKKYFIIALILFCMIIASRFQVQSDIQEDITIFGKLTSSGWILITSKNDQLCKRQFEILGHMQSIVPRWDIFDNRDKIIRIGARDIESVPCWFNVFTKKHKYGILSLNKIKKLLLKKIKQKP